MTDELPTTESKRAALVTTITDAPMPPARAARLLRAIGGDLEACLHRGSAGAGPRLTLDQVGSHCAMVALLLAQHIERFESSLDTPEGG